MITNAEYATLNGIVADHVAMNGLTESINTYTRLLHKYTHEFAQTASATNYRLVEKCMLALQDLHIMRADLRQRNRIRICPVCVSENKPEFKYCDSCGTTL